MHRKAFTLIELLVVIAIIAILAAILFPVFAQAKTAAKKTVSIFNAKQTGTAMQIYLGDSDDVYPVPDVNRLQELGGEDPPYYTIGFKWLGRREVLSTNDVNYHNTYSFATQMQPYMKNRELFSSPLDPSVKTTFTQPTNVRPSSFTYRFYLGLGWFPFVQGDGRSKGSYSATSFQAPASTFIYHDILPWTDLRYVPMDRLGGADGWAPDVRMTFVMGDTHTKQLPIDKALRKKPYGTGWDYHWPRRGTQEDDWLNALAGEPDLD